jgi:uncharacterized membrane protein YedE/YeeE
METILPLYTSGLLDNSTNLWLALGIGIMFGFILERAGFGTAGHIAPVFYFKNIMVAQVMVSAIVTAATLLILGISFGYIDFNNVFVPTTYLWAYLVGGLIFGVGMVMSGWCPGTSLVGIATGKIDALFFALGLFVGMFFYFDIYQYISDFANGANLGKFTINKALGISLQGAYLVTVAVSLGLLFFMMAMHKLAKNKGDK